MQELQELEELPRVPAGHSSVRIPVSALEELLAGTEPEPKEAASVPRHSVYTALAEAAYAGRSSLRRHHARRISDAGAYDPASVIALCPTCHRRVHYGADGDAYNDELLTKVPELKATVAAAAV